jgi:hypothetical protein
MTARNAGQKLAGVLEVDTPQSIHTTVRWSIVTG